MPIRNDPKPTTTTPKTPTAKTPTPAEQKALEAAAKAKADEGAEDIDTLQDQQPQVTATPNDRSGAAYRTVVANLDNAVVTSDGDVANALAAIETLSPGEARATLEALKKDGSLDTLIAESDGANRSRLVDLLIHAGLVGAETGVAGTPGPRGPLPPAPPTLAKNDPALPDNLNALLRDENVARASQYREEFKEYRASYQEAVRGAKDWKEFRALGKITEPALPPWEPGAKHTDTDREWSDLARRAPDKRTAEIVTDKMFVLNGRTPPGTDFTFEGSIEVGIAHIIELEAEVEITQKRNGAVEGEASAGATAKLGPGPIHLRVGGGVDAKLEKGEIEAAPKGNVGIGLGEEVSIDKGDGDIAFETKNMKVEVSKEKGLKAEVDAGVKVGIEADGKKAVVTAGVEGVAAKAGLDKDGGMIAGVEAEAEFKGELFEAEVSVGGTVTVQLASRADYEAFVAVIESDPFDTPAELARGIKWEKLSPGAQQAYALFGWSAKDWNAAAGGNNAIRAGMIGGR